MFPSKQCLAIGRSRSSGFVTNSRRGAPLSNEHAERLAELVKAAVEHGPEGWPAFLDEACRFDPAMRAKVEGLLVHPDRAGRFIEQPALRLAAGTLFRDGPLEASEAMRS